MSQLSGCKLNQLLGNWPSGVVYTSAWLHGRGYGYDLLNKYRKSGWVRAIGKGALVRAGDTFDWTGGLHAMQNQLKLSIHAGGKTALQMQGYAHFLPLGKDIMHTDRIRLFGPPGCKLPRWFKHRDWNIPIKHTMTNMLPFEADMGFIKKEMGRYQITLSAPERAIFEVLHQVTLSETFDESKLLMDGLATLRPQLVQKLLIHCKSIKTKRLFLFLADVCNHQWLKRVDVSKVNLGKGKRVVVKDGKYDSKYQITIPKHFDANSLEGIP